jgi:hypothetical protein
MNMTLPVIEESFVPANNRAWLVRFWELPAEYVGIACPFGLVLFILFYFDANVSVSPPAFNADCSLSLPKEQSFRSKSRQDFTGTSSCSVSPPSLLVYSVYPLPTVSFLKHLCTLPAW